MSVTKLDQCQFLDLAKRVRRCRGEFCTDAHIMSRFDISASGLLIVDTFNREVLPKLQAGRS